MEIKTLEPHVPDDVLFSVCLDANAPLTDEHRRHLATCSWCQYRVKREREDNPFCKPV